MTIENPNANSNQQSVGKTSNDDGIEFEVSPEGTTDTYTIAIHPPANGRVDIRGKENGDTEIEVTDSQGNVTKYVPGGTGSALGKQ